MELNDKLPYELNSDAINIVQLAMTLQECLENACSMSGIDDTFRLSCSYEALAELAKNLAIRINDYDGVFIPTPLTALPAA